MAVQYENRSNSRFIYKHIPIFTCMKIPVTDPGFPVGGDVDSRGGYVSKILCVEMKESGPMEGACAGNAP